MKKATKRVFSLLLIMVLLFISSTLPASASIYPTTVGVKSDAVTVSNVTITINSYFAQRKAYMKGNAETISIAFTGIVADESRHKAKLAEEDIYFADSQIVINDISCGDAIGLASVTETVQLCKDDIIYTEQSIHEITIYSINGVLSIGADAYRESFSNFESCSFVQSNAVSTCSTPVGGAPCICQIARNEIGYTESGDNITKYGAFLGMNGYAWCGSFVAWCAYRANVATSIIPRASGTWTMYDHFNGNNAYYKGRSFGGTVEPKSGDIFFLGNGTPAGITHVGIVVSTDANNIYVVEGNWSDRVNYRAISKSASDLMGYGRPAYATSTHPNTYRYDDTYHWTLCSVCGYTGTQARHNLQPSGQYNELVCTDCGYASGMQVASH